MPHDHGSGAASAHGELHDAVGRRDGAELPLRMLRYCPECGMPAWVEWRDTAGGAGAAYVKVRCFARHWFLVLEEPEDRLTVP